MPKQVRDYEAQRFILELDKFPSFTSVIFPPILAILKRISISVPAGGVSSNVIEEPSIV